MKEKKRKNRLIQLFPKIILVIVGLCLFSISSQAQTSALRYDICVNPQQSMPCAVAFEKLRITKNPVNKKNFFEDDVHIKDDKLLNFPTYYVAQPDLDNDGVKEIIVALLEENKASKGLFCKSKYECPHFIIQDRNVNKDKPRLKYYSMIAAPYAYGVGLSTDESVGGYQSLRVYTSDNPKEFNVYQYDKKDDAYYNISGRK